MNRMAINVELEHETCPIAEPSGKEPSYTQK
jgi:hypothetical protein